VIRDGLVGPKRPPRGGVRWTPGRQSWTSDWTDAGCGRLGSAARRAPSKPVGSVGLVPRAMTERRERAGVATPTARELRPGRRERPARGEGRCPYRKPTQVGWQSMPRWTSDPWLRNSAIYARTFARSATGRGDGPCGLSTRAVTQTRPRRLAISTTGPCSSRKTRYTG
jgi:hypothetical protein